MSRTTVVMFGGVPHPRSRNREAAELAAVRDRQQQQRNRVRAKYTDRFRKTKGYKR